MPAWVINTSPLEYFVLSMLAFTGKYGNDDLSLNKYTHTIKVNYTKVSV